jgi:hypothetical protein
MKPGMMQLLVMSNQVMEFHTENVKQGQKFNSTDDKFTFKEMLYEK